jgi:hypothetical protein
MAGILKSVTWGNRDASLMVSRVGCKMNIYDALTPIGEERGWKRGLGFAVEGKTSATAQTPRLRSEECV